MPVARILPCSDSWAPRHRFLNTQLRPDARMGRRSDLQLRHHPPRHDACTARESRIREDLDETDVSNGGRSSSRVVFTTILWFCFPAQPNESRLSCGAPKKDSFHNLRAPP